MKTKCVNVLDVLAKKLEFKPFVYETTKDVFGIYPTEKTINQIRTGAVLKLRRKKPRYALVGTVNRLLGVCDDCKNFELEDIEAIAYLDDLFK